MRRAGLCGVSRRKGLKTTVRQPGARAAPDLVQRRFTAEGSDRLWVADITYVPTLAGFLFLYSDQGAQLRCPTIGYVWM